MRADQTRRNPVFSIFEDGETQRQIPLSFVLTKAKISAQTRRGFSENKMRDILCVSWAVSGTSIRYLVGGLNATSECRLRIVWYLSVSMPWVLHLIGKGTEGWIW